jgi:hypothetical protein
MGEQGMAKFWFMALALLVSAGLWSAPAMAAANETDDVGSTQSNGGEDGAADATLGSKGLVWTTDGFSLRVTTRVQFRLTYQNEVANGENGTNGRDFVNFNIRRAKTKFSGHIFQKEFQYELLLGWTHGSASLIEEAWFRWAFMQYLNINAGQEKLDFNWEESTSSGSQQFVERSLLNETFNEDYAKGIWIDGRIGEDVTWLKYVIGVYNGVLRGNNDFRNNDQRINSEVFTDGVVDGEMMLNLRLETHPLGDVKHGMNDMRGEDEYDQVLFAIGIGVNYFISGFNNSDLRPDSVGTATASGRNRTQQDTWTMTMDAHFRWHGLSADLALFYRHTDFHNRGRNRYSPTSSYHNGIGDLTDIGWGIEVAYFILAKQLSVGVRFNSVDADEFWMNGSDGRDFGIRPDSTELGLSVNYYIQGDNLKITFDLHMVSQQLPFLANADANATSQALKGVYNAPPGRQAFGGSNDSADHNDIWIVRLQLQWIF